MRLLGLMTLYGVVTGIVYWLAAQIGLVDLAHLPIAVIWAVGGYWSGLQTARR